MARENDKKQSVGVPGRALTNRDILQVLSTGVAGIRARLLLGRGGDGTERWGEPFMLPNKYVTKQCHLPIAPDHQLCCAHALRELQAVTDAAPGSCQGRPEGRSR